MNRLKKKIFIWEFVWSEDLIKHIIQICDKKEIEICGWAVRKKDIKRITNVWPDAPVFEAPLPSDLNDIDYTTNLFEGFSFEEEENIRFLLDREGTYQNNMHSSQVRYEVYAWVETLLKRAKPDWLLFSDVPHNIFTYLLYLSGGRMGIKSLMIRHGFPPHLLTINSTVERKIIDICQESDHIDLSSQTVKYLNVLKNDDTQEPAYMLHNKKKIKPLQVIKRSVSKGFDFFNKKSIDAALVYWKRKQLKSFYESLCDSKLELTKNNPYIAVFLHLQPERTTMPEGGIFAQQWLMIQMLSKICSETGYNLYIKEHPSTFMSGPNLYRGKWFYKSVVNLPKASLISLSINSASIIKNAKAVATITGTAGLEAVVKGIPALIFGESVISGCAGTYRIKEEIDLKDAISSIQEDIEIKFDDIKRFFSALEKDENSHIIDLTKGANRRSLWVNGIPQTVMFSKMVQNIENE